MKLENKLAKILAEHPTDQVVAILAQQVGIPKLLLAVSNLLMGKMKANDKVSRKTWTKRAKAVHAVMDEIIAEQPGGAGS